jgi:glycosyltransferase involved in cell wall biosynthesis
LKQNGKRFTCRIVGFGPLEKQLEDLIGSLGLQDSVFLVGKMTQDKLIQEYRKADLFVLPCLVTDDGDRDGIPNVLVEAMAMRIPVVSTPISGIVELIDHMQNGVLAPEKDVESLRRAMEMLLENPGLRERLGGNARQKVMANFSLDRSTAKLRCLFAGPGSAWASIRTIESQDLTDSGSIAQGTTETPSLNPAHGLPPLPERASR